jgi:hypothetical protein
VILGSSAAAAERIAAKSRGNFLYAYHVLNEFLRSDAHLEDFDSAALPDELEDVYRKFLKRELAATPTGWQNHYRPLLGLITVARGDGLTRGRLIEITGLAEDTAGDVLTTRGEYTK